MRSGPNNRRRANRHAAGSVALGVLVSLLVLALVGCAPQPAGDFAIYLPAEAMPASDMADADLASVQLQDAPLISTEDIVSYAWATHEIELTAAAFERVQQLRVPVSGTAFVACVGRKPVYWGAFWTMASSLSFDGVSIMMPFGADSRLIRIELGYPSPDFFAGDDPRADGEIRRALERAGKLR